MPNSTFGFVLTGAALPEFNLPLVSGGSYSGQLTVVASLLEPVPSQEQILTVRVLGLNTIIDFGLHLSDAVPGTSVTIPVSFVAAVNPRVAFRLVNVDYEVAVTAVFTVNSLIVPP